MQRGTSGGSSNGAVARCPFCGTRLQVVAVHGHGQCAACGTNVEPCCTGADAADEAASTGRTQAGLEPGLFATLFAQIGGRAATVTTDSLVFALGQRLGCDLDEARLYVEAGERTGLIQPVGEGCHRLRGA
jgi:hypothetical protein